MFEVKRLYNTADTLSKSIVIASFSMIDASIITSFFEYPSKEALASYSSLYTSLNLFNIFLITSYGFEFL